MEKRHPAAQRLGSPAEMAALTLPAEAIGAMFYDAVNSLWYYWDGSQWLPFGTGGGGAWPAPLKTMVGTTEYDTIQEAITAAAAWEVVKIGEGDYTENLVIDKAMTILAWPSTVNVYTDAAKGVEVTVGNVVWDGPNIESSSAAATSHALYLGLGGTVKNCDITNDSGGDYAYGVTSDVGVTLEAVTASANSGAVEAAALWIKSGNGVIRGGAYSGSVADLKLDNAVNLLLDLPQFGSVTGATGSASLFGFYLDASFNLQRGELVTIPEMTGDSGSGGRQGAVPAPAAGDTAAGKFLSAAGAWDVPAGGSGFPFNIITVDPTDPDADYSDFVTANAAATASDAIFVGPGTYTVSGVTCLAGAVIGLVPRKVIFDNNFTGNNFCLRMRFGYIESVDFLNADSSAGPVVGLLIDTQNGGVMVVDCQSDVENATDMPAWAFRVTSTGLSIYDVIFRNCRGDALRKAHHTDVQTGLGVTTNPVTVYGGYFRGNFATDYDIYQTGAGTVQLVNPLLAYGTTSGAVTGFFFDASGNLKRVGGTLPTIPEMIGDSGAGGFQGAAPAPGAGDAAAGKFLKADGTWDTPAGGDDKIKMVLSGIF